MSQNNSLHLDRILIVGDGFIGSFFSKDDNFVQLDKENHRILKYLYKSSVSEFQNLVKAIDKLNPGAIVNVSGPADVFDSFNKPDLYIEMPKIQCRSHLELIKYLDKEIPYLFFSSAAVYGDCKNLPTSEDQSPNPVSPYGIGKIKAEKVIENFSHNFDLPAAILRVYSAYAKDLKKQLPYLLANNIVAQKTFSLFGNGHELRDYVHLEDVKRLIPTVVENAFQKKFEIFNVGSGTALSIVELCEIADIEFRNRFDLSSPPHTFTGVKRTGDPNCMLSDNAKLNKLIDFEFIDPRVGMHDYFREFFNQLSKF